MFFHKPTCLAMPVNILLNSRGFRKHNFGSTLGVSDVCENTKIKIKFLFSTHDIENEVLHMINKALVFISNKL